jgi:hypothetical protein
MKYKSLTFFVFLFAFLFFVPIFSKADPVCSPACASNEICESAGYQGSTEIGYCTVNYNTPAYGFNNSNSGDTSSSGSSSDTSGSTSSSGAICSPSCGSGEICESAGYVGSTQIGYCTVNYNGTGNSSGSSGNNSSANQPSQCLLSLLNGVNVCLGSGCSLDPSGQTCSAPVASTASAASQQAACSQISSSDLTSDLQSSVSGSGPNGSTNYNTADYATPAAASLLAQCLGGTVVSTSNEAAGSSFYIPPTLQIRLPNGTMGNAGQLLQQLITVNGGNVSGFQNGSYMSQVLSSNATTYSSGCTSATTYSVTTGLRCTTSSSTTSGSGGTTSGTTSTTSGSVDTSCISDGTCTSDQLTAIAQQEATTATATAKQQISSSVQITLNNIKSSINYFMNQFQSYQQSLGYNYGAIGIKTAPSATASGALSLSMDSTGYCVYSDGSKSNDTAVYTVQGGRNLANQKVVWSSTKNGAKTGESNSYYGQNLNASSFWSGNASAPWSVSDIGSWTKTASAFDGTNINAVSTPFSFTVKDCSGSANSSTVATGGKTSNFDYTFTKVGNAWKVTLDNAALGTPTDFFYIPADTSITAISAYDLNMQNQARYNTMSYFPGNASGNTFYSGIFGAFTAAFYDWDNQTGTNSSSNSGPTVDSLTVNGFQSITVKVGDTVNYVWSSVGGTSYDSYYSASKPDTCSGGFDGSISTKPWVATSASGSVSQTAAACQAGVTYTIDYRVHNAIGTPDSIKSVIVTVTN